MEVPSVAKGCRVGADAEGRNAPMDGLSLTPGFGWMHAHHTVVWTKQNRGRAYRSHGSGARMTPTWLGSGRTAFFDREHPAGGGEARGSSVVGGVSGRALLPAKLATSVVRVRGVIFGLSEEVSEVRYRRDVAVEAGWKYIRNRMWRWHQTRRSDGVVRD